MSDAVELDRLTYNELTPWETVVFHEESKMSLGDMQRVGAAVRAAGDDGEVELGDVPVERIPLALLAAAARRHTGNEALSLREAGSGGFRFRAEVEDEAPKAPVPTSTGE